MEVVLTQSQSSVTIFRRKNAPAMNIMRKFWGGGATGTGGSGGSGGVGGVGEAVQEYHPEQELLGLNHLKKVYAEYSVPTASHASSAAGVGHQLSAAERESKLYSMLPLFCKIFNSVPPSGKIYTIIHE